MSGFCSKVENQIVPGEKVEPQKIFSHLPDLQTIQEAAELGCDFAASMPRFGKLFRISIIKTSMENFVLNVLSFNVLESSSGLFPIVNLKRHEELIQIIQNNKNKNPFKDIIHRISSHVHDNDPHERLTLMDRFPTSCIYSSKNGSIISPISPMSGYYLNALDRKNCKLVAVYKKSEPSTYVEPKSRRRKPFKSPVAPEGLWSKYGNSHKEGCIDLPSNVTKTLWEGDYCRPHMPLDPEKTYSKSRKQLLLEYVDYCIVNQKMNVILLQESFDDLTADLTSIYNEDFYWHSVDDLTIGILKSIVDDEIFIWDFQQEGMFRLMENQNDGSLIEDTGRKKVYPRIFINGFMNNQTETYIYIVNVHLKGGHDDKDQHEKAEAIYMAINQCHKWAVSYGYIKYVILIGGDFNHNVQEVSNAVYWFVNKDIQLRLKFVQPVEGEYKKIDGFLMYTFNQNCTMSISFSEYYYNDSFEELIEKNINLGNKLKKMRNIIEHNIYPANCSEILKVSDPYKGDEYGITEHTAEQSMMTQMSDHYPVGVKLVFHTSMMIDVTNHIINEAGYNVRMS